MISADLISTTVLKYQAAIPLFEIAWTYTSNLSFIIIALTQIRAIVQN